MFFLSILSDSLDDLLYGLQVCVEVEAIDDGDHGVEAGDLLETEARVVLEGKGLGDGERLRHARRLNEKVVELLLLGQACYLLDQVLSQGAADASVLHFNKLFLSSLKSSITFFHESTVNIDLTHVVDDDSDLEPLSVLKDLVH